MSKQLSITQVSAPGPAWITTDLMVKIEEKYKANYCGCLSFKAKDDRWTPMPFPIFYNESPPNESYHPYFALFVADKKLMIAGALGVSDIRWAAVHDTKNDKYLISNYRHGYRENGFGDFVDGGPEYTRAGGVHVHQLVLINGIWNVL